jgi:hypothetical protein
VLVLIIIIIIAVSAGGKDKNNTGTKNTPVPSTSKTTETTKAPTEKTPATTSVSLELSNGNFTSGIDFPAGKYDIEAVSGSGNISSSNMYSGGINAAMGTEEANNAIVSDLYEQKYSNIDLSDGVVLYISGVTVKITSEAADGSPLKTREQPNTKTIDLRNGNFVSGTDFPAGTYDIIAVSGGGNVSSDNMYGGGLNAVMGVAEKNKEIGLDMYQQEYKNIELPEGTTLTISGVDIQLVPSK